MNTVNQPPDPMEQSAAHFGFTRFGSSLPGATLNNWMNRPGTSLGSGKMSRLSRVVYVAENEVRVWGVRYPGLDASGTVADGRKFLKDLLHQAPAVRWMAFDQDGNRGFSAADLWLNTPGGAMVAYSTIKRGMIRSRPALFGDIVMRLRRASEGQSMDATEARNLARRWLRFVSDNAAGNLDKKGADDFEKLRSKIAISGQSRKSLLSAETLYLRHLDTAPAELVARHVELFWESTHA